MVTIRTVEIDGIVAEAIGALGFFHPNSTVFIAARIARLWGGNARAFEMDGERIKPMPDRPRYQVAGEIWGCLSESGRSDPSYACQATWLRINFNVRRAMRKGDEVHWRDFSTGAQFSCHEEHACAKSRANKGAVVQLTAVPRLPLAGCDADWCSCEWRPVLG